MLDPIANPRYLLVRTSLFGRIRRSDYHAVPREIARRRDFADYFERMWRKYVGSAEVVYTRRRSGRRLLLKARAHSLSGALRPRSERLSAWK